MAAASLPVDDARMNRILKIIRGFIIVASVAFALIIIIALLVVKPSPRETPTRQLPWNVQQPSSEAQTLIDRISAANIDRDHLYLTSESHMAGSPRDYETAVWVEQSLANESITTVIDEYQVGVSRSIPQLLGEPHGHSLRGWDAAQNFSYQARLEEVVLEEDPSTKKADVPTFHGYGASGNVTGELVYVNYGHVADFEHLMKEGIELKGKIAIARYGRTFRGIKVKNAQEHGMIGVLIYSDPQDTGFVQGEPVPGGPFGSEWSVQRGSVQFLQMTPGDPTTPFFASTPENEAHRLPMDEVTTIPSIPSQPISWGDAQPLLRMIAGTKAPQDWQGGLDFEYYIGPGPVTVNLFVNNTYSIKPIWNVRGSIVGSAEPDRWIVLGNHRDAWVFGGVDPSSGTAPLVEIARSFGHLLRSGWRPKRTIVFGSWDAEEWALVGSTEYVENYYDEIREKVVAYINVDESVVGEFSFRILSTPCLADFFVSLTRHIPIPPEVQQRPVPPYGHGRDRAGELLCDGCNTLFDYWLHGQQIAAGRQGETPSDKPYTYNVGSGSDYTPFFQFAGAPSADLRFIGDYNCTSGYGVYHSMYDTHYYVETHLDPGFLLHKALTQLWALSAITLADSPLLPLNYEAYAYDMKQGLKNVKQQITTLGMGQNVALKVAIDALSDSIASFTRAASSMNNVLEEAMRSSTTEQKYQLNSLLMETERQFLSNEGLPSRPWYRHFVFAPAIELGYGATIFPAVTDGLYFGNVTQACEGVDMTLERLNAASNILLRSRELL